MNAERWSFIAWTCVLWLWAFPAHARIVVVLRPELAEASVLETSNRIHGELLAVGLSVRVLSPEGDSALDSGAWLQALNEEQEVDAALEVQNTSPPKVTVWILARGTQPRRIAEVSVEPGTHNASEKLAIRAIDVLRSAFLERDLASRQSAPPAVPAAAPDPAQETSAPTVTVPLQLGSGRLGLALGIAALTSLDGVGPALMPTLQLDVALTPKFTLYAAGAGFGSRSRVESGAHSVDVQQSHAVLGVRYFLTSTENLRPFAALALGAMATSIEAHPAPPAQGHDQNLNSLLMDAGLGLDWLWQRRYYTRFAAHVQFANPSATVHVVDSAVASTGQPNLALTLMVGAWL